MPPATLAQEGKVHRSRYMIWRHVRLDNAKSSYLCGKNPELYMHTAVYTMFIRDGVECNVMIEDGNQGE